MARRRDPLESPGGAGHSTGLEKRSGRRFSREASSLSSAPMCERAHFARAASRSAENDRGGSCGAAQLKFEAGSNRADGVIRSCCASNAYSCPPNARGTSAKTCTYVSRIKAFLLKHGSSVKRFQRQIPGRAVTRDPGAPDRASARQFVRPRPALRGLRAANVDRLDLELRTRA